MINRKHLLLTLLLILCQISVCSAKTITIKGNIYDRRTAKDLTDTKIQIYTPDSVLVTETVADQYEVKRKGSQWYYEKAGKFSIDVPDTLKQYILLATHDDYESLYHNIDLSELGSKQYEMQLSPLYMAPAAKVTELDDFTVKATKIKFYHKGDTIVYNADAFQLPEGSMLDALIAQLPGVEIKDGGKIYVNGKYVESMLLNGKDFFKGNQKVLRDNIGAYSVKSVEVYDKYKEMSTLMGKQIEGDSEFVMDVKLKKDYMTGFMGNAQAGYGTHGRYTGNVFAAMFNNVANFGVYGNVNNLGEESRPNSGDGYSMYTQPRPGVTNVANGGFDYNVEDQKKVWSVNGNVNAMYTDNLLKTNSTSEAIIPGGNTFSTSIQQDRNYNLNLSTNHMFRLWKPNFYWRIDPDFTYTRSNGHSNNASVTFNDNIQERYDVDSRLIQALYNSNNPEEIKKAIVNRNNFIRHNRSNTWKGHVYNETTYKFPKSPNALTVWIEGQYERQHSSSQTSQLIDFGYNPAFSQPVNSRAQQRTKLSYPFYDFYAKGAARYYINSKYLSYSFCYEFRHEQTRKTNEEYLFESIAENQEALIPDIYTEIADLPNTSRSKLFNNINMFKAKIEYSKPKIYKEWKFDAGLSGEYHLLGRHLDYMGYSQNTETLEIAPTFIPVSRFSGNFRNCNAYLRYSDQSSLYKQVSLSYGLDTRYASLMDMIDLPNTADPLNLYIGNPNLKNSIVQTLNLYAYGKLAKNTSVSMNSYNTYTTNPITKGYIYYRDTGIREYRSYNTAPTISSYVNGYASQTFGPSDRFYAFTNLGYGFNRYTNMVGNDGPAIKQLIYTNSFNTRLGMQYSIDNKLRANLTMRYGMTYLHSDQTRNRTQAITPGGFIWYKLPAGFEVSVDYNFTKQYGLGDKSIKDTYHHLSGAIWYVINSSWSVHLMAKDVLNSGLAPNVVSDANGRSQTYRNSLPRYFMISVYYKFNTKKK